MMDFYNVWSAGFTALTLGVIGAAVAVTRLRRLSASGADLEMQINDIDEQLEHMVAQLRDLDQQRERISGDFYHSEKRHYEGKAAQLLRQRDHVSDLLRRAHDSGQTVDATPLGKPREAAVEVSPAMHFFAARPRLVGALWGAAALVVVGGLVLSVTYEQAPRAVGTSLTGNSQSATAGGDASPAASGQLERLIAELDDDPNNVDALNELTGLLLRQQRFSEAAELNRRALEHDPTNTKSRIYAALLKSASGLGAEAAKELDTITSENPDVADGWFFRGMLAMQSGDRGKTREVWSRYVEVAPPGPRRARIEKILKTMD